MVWVEVEKYGGDETEQHVLVVRAFYFGRKRRVFFFPDYYLDPHQREKFIATAKAPRGLVSMSAAGG